MNEFAKRNAGYAAIAGLLMCFFGWFWTAKGISDSRFYNFTVDFFYWVLRVGGLLIIAAAAVCATGRRVGLLIDGILSTGCGAIMAACGAYWAVYGGFNVWYVLYVIFGGMFVSAGLRALREHRASAADEARGGRGPAQPPRAAGVVRMRPPDPPSAPPAEPVHPASIRPRSIPPGSDPPPQGYLAALAREDEEPPKATYE